MGLNWAPTCGVLEPALPSKRQLWISSKLHVQRHHIFTLKSDMRGVFTPWKWANATNQGYFSPQRTGCSTGTNTLLALSHPTAGQSCGQKRIPFSPEIPGEPLSLVPTDARAQTFLSDSPLQPTLFMILITNLSQSVLATVAEYCRLDG